MEVFFMFIVVSFVHASVTTSAPISMGLESFVFFGFSRCRSAARVLPFPS